MSATKQHSFAAIVLAAGAGTRFGEPKVNAVLPDGRRFVDVVVEHCLTTGADPVIVIVPQDVNVPPGARAVVNRRGKDEQIISLRMGLAQFANTSVQGALVWPVDFPFVQATSAMAVVDAARRTSARIVAPVFEGARGHPVWFARETWRELMAVPSGGARAVVHAYGNRVHEVAVSDPGIHRDIDTKADLDG
jgi:molybdenum cofactor cytidylyltransferase